jgi:hypothetical protein
VLPVKKGLTLVELTKSKNVNNEGFMQHRKLNTRPSKKDSSNLGISIVTSSEGAFPVTMLPDSESPLTIIVDSSNAFSDPIVMLSDAGVNSSSNHLQAFEIASRVAQESGLRISVPGLELAKPWISASSSTLSLTHAEHAEGIARAEGLTIDVLDDGGVNALKASESKHSLTFKNTTNADRIAQAKGLKIVVPNEDTAINALRIASPTSAALFQHAANVDNIAGRLTITVPENDIGLHSRGEGVVFSASTHTSLVRAGKQISKSERGSSAAVTKSLAVSSSSQARSSSRLRVDALSSSSSSSTMLKPVSRVPLTANRGSSIFASAGASVVSVPTTTSVATASAPKKAFIVN